MRLTGDPHVHWFRPARRSSEGCLADGEHVELRKMDEEDLILECISAEVGEHSHLAHRRSIRVQV